MEALKYFFRGTADGYSFTPFTPTHFLLLLMTAVGVLLIVKNRERLIDTKVGGFLRFGLIFLLLAQQIILYFWYGLSGYFTVQEGLPLYNCRFAIWMAAFALLTRKRSLQAIVSYWGIFGSFLALISPAVDPFSFPHYTNFSFFGGHMLLVWAAFFILFVDMFRVDESSLKFILRFTTGYHLLIYAFNKVTASNYCYLMEAPIAQKFFANLLPPVVYALLVIFLWNLLLVGFYLSARSIDRIMTQHDDEDSKFAF